jgi:hypothetical protein
MSIKRILAEICATCGVSHCVSEIYGNWEREGDKVASFWYRGRRRAIMVPKWYGAISNLLIPEDIP